MVVRESAPRMTPLSKVMAILFEGGKSGAVRGGSDMNVAEGTREVMAYIEVPRLKPTNISRQVSTS